MIEILKFMSAPFAACFVLIGILGYFGIHVLKREIIFIDIALAQIATLGVTVAFLLRISPHSNTAYFFSLGFTVAAAAVYALTRSRRPSVPQEGIIGISYVVAAAAALLLTDRAAGGAEHIKDMLMGSILWVKWKEVGLCAVVSLLVGGFHFALRKSFLLVSEDYDLAIEQGMSVRLWDFIFYVTFGLVITHAVRIGGILVVFSFLIIPATISALFASSWGARIVIAWGVGLVASAFGLYTSYVLDFSSGPAIVCFLGIFLLLATIAERLSAARARWALRGARSPHAGSGPTRT